jgi:hypothetical protein
MISLLTSQWPGHQTIVKHAKHLLYAIRRGSWEKGVEIDGLVEGWWRLVVVVAAKVVGRSVIIPPNRPATKTAGDPMAAHGPQRATVARMFWL